MVLINVFLYGIQENRFTPGLVNKYFLRFCDQEKALHFQHYTASQVVHYYGNNYNEYFKFSFVRNSRDRAISDWAWLQMENNFTETLKNFLLRKGKFKKPFERKGASSRKDHFIPQCNFLLDEND